MKRVLLAIPQILMFTIVFGQTINDHKVTIRYIQLPTDPLPENITGFNVALIKSYESANEDSISSYSERLEKLIQEQETLLEEWKSDKKRIDKIYYAEMATWQKAVNSGNTTVAKPQDPVYPNYPILKDLPLPILTEEVGQEATSSRIEINGYSKDNGSAILSINHNGIKNATIKKSIIGKGAMTKYNYTAYYSMPIQIKLYSEETGVLYERSFYENETKKLIKSESSEYDYKIWWIDNEENYWKSLQNNLFNAALSKVNSELNEKFGFPVKSNNTEVYVVKKYKNHNYSRFVDALTYAKSGYDLLSSDVNKIKAKEKINKSINIWLDLLKESNLSDNKSKINKKVTALLYANLAEAFLWIDDFENADLYANKGITLGVLKYKNHCKRVHEKIGLFKSRYMANQ